MCVLHGVVCHVWDVHYVCVHTVEEKALGIFRVWKPIQSVYEIKTNVEEVKDWLMDKYQYFISV